MQKLVQKLSSLPLPNWLRGGVAWAWQRFFLLAVVVLVVFAAWTNYSARDKQWEVWQAYPGSFASGGMPLFSAADSGFFVNLADDYLAGEVRFQPLRLFPDSDPVHVRASDPVNGEVRAKEITTPYTMGDLGMLEVTLAYTAKFFTGGDTVRAGFALIPITAFMTAFAIALMFWAAGHPIEGSIAATAFGISPMFFGRTAIGRVDTDLLIFFFFGLCATFVLLAAHQSRLLRAVIFAGIAAVVLRIFGWWYPQPIFSALLPGLLFASSFLAGMGRDQIAYVGGDTRWGRGLTRFMADKPPLVQNGITAAIPFLVMVVITGPIAYVFNIGSFIGEALTRLGILTFQAAENPNVNLIFPDTYTTVDELVRVPFNDILQAIAFSPFLGVFGIIGFFIWGVTKPSRGIVFLPYIMLGLLSVITARRFAVYAAPFVWFGAAWLGLFIVRFGLDQINLWRREKQRQVVTVLVAGIAVLIISWPYAFSMARVPSPSFPSPIVSIFQTMKNQTTSRSDTRAGHPGIIATWWDYGYIAALASDKGTLHDGGSQRSPRTHLVARGFVDRDLNQLTQIIKFVASEGTKGITDNSQDLASLDAAIAAASMPDVPVYIAVTSQFASWMPAIARLGLFNTETGTPLDPNIEADFSVREPECFKYDQVNSVIECVGLKIDFRRGTIDDQPVIRLVAQLNNGRLIRQQEFRNRGDWVLVLANVGQQTVVRLIKLRMWRSNLYQLMEVGVFDSDTLRLVLDEYPHGRVYELLR